MTRRSNKTAKPLGDEQLFHICEQYAMLFAAGITPYEATQVMLRDEENNDLVPALNCLLAGLEKGETISAAAASTGLFPSYVSELFRVAEQTGHLDEVSGILADYYEGEADLRVSIRQAVSYPIIMIVMMFAVVIVLISRVMPLFQRVFNELGASMGGFAGVLMHVSNVLVNSYAVLIALFAVFAALYVLFSRTEWGRRQFRRFLGWFPPTRDFARKLDVQRFSSAMQMTTSAGIDPYKALYLSSGILTNAAVLQKVRTCMDLVQAGGSLADALVQTGMYSTFYSSMIQVAARTGRLDQIMGFIADHYREESGRTMTRVLSSIEPTMVAVLSIVIGLVLLSVILPLMGVMSTIG